MMRTTKLFPPNSERHNVLWWQLPLSCLAVVSAKQLRPNNTHYRHTMDLNVPPIQLTFFQNVVKWTSFALGNVGMRLEHNNSATPHTWLSHEKSCPQRLDAHLLFVIVCIIGGLFYVFALYASDFKTQLHFNQAVVNILGACHCVLVVVEMPANTPPTGAFTYSGSGVLSFWTTKLFFAAGPRITMAGMRRVCVHEDICHVLVRWQLITPFI
jgi:hypothetical protein